MSSPLPLNVNDDVREDTRRPVIFESAFMISSAMPSAKKSPSGSELMFVNGSTAIDFAAAPPGDRGLPSGVVRWAATRALAKSTVVLNLSAASFDNARSIAVSMKSVASGYTFLSDGTGSLNRLLRTACAVGPVNGFFPDSNSYKTHARLYL